MSYEFRPAARENVSLLIGLAGPSGGGKTYTAMRLAKGLAGDMPFAVIDTEAGRAKHYADLFQFDHCDLMAPFSPQTYAAAIKAADLAHYPVVIVDSLSHEHAGEGGLLDQHEQELTRMAGDDWKKREAMKMAAWVRPKMAHKAMVQKLLQVRAHLIICLRAEEKIEMVRGRDGKVEIVPKQTLSGFKGWIPICEKNLPFELTASFVLTPDQPGCPQPIKLQEQHRAFFPSDQPITEASGRQLAEWARGSRGALSGGLVARTADESGGLLETPGRPPGHKNEAPGQNAPTPRVLIPTEAPPDPKVSALRALQRAYDALGMPATEWRAVLTAKLGTAELETADVVTIDEVLLPFLRKVARKDSAALDELADILAKARAS